VTVNGNNNRCCNSFGCQNISRHAAKQAARKTEAFMHVIVKNGVKGENRDKQRGLGTQSQGREGGKKKFKKFKKSVDKGV